METNPTRHVVIALMLTAALFIIAGDRWAENVGALRPIRAADKK